MSVSLKFEGLAEMLTELRNLPAEFTGEAGHIVEGAANGAGVAIRSGYGSHRVTGNLQDHVVVEQRSAGRFGVGYVVKSTARHAHLFEFGTQARHYVTVRGKQHLTGRMPPNPVFIPAMVRARRAMYEQLRGVLVRAGLQVTGEP